MLKNTFYIASTLLLLIGASYGLSKYHHTNFIDYSFFIGLIVTVSIIFFTSTGEVKARFFDSSFQGRMGLKASFKHQEFSFSPNVPFYTSLVFTIITFTAMFFD